MKKLRSPFVLNYEPDEDIHVLAGDIDLSALKHRLPGSFERFLGTTYFNRKSEHFAEIANDIFATWYFRAALAHFQGILDLVEADLPSSCGQLWKRNDIRQNLYSHRLVYTMTRVRNLALHTSKLGCSMENRDILFLPGGERSVTKLVFQQITPDHFERRDEIEPEAIEWFNRQAQLWSANALLTQSAFILMIGLLNFVLMNADIVKEREEVQDRIRRAVESLSFGDS